MTDINAMVIEAPEDDDLYSEPDDPVGTSAAHMRALKDEGLRIVFPKDNELQIDLDNEAQVHQLNELWPVLLRAWPTATYVVTASRGGGQHVTVTLPFIVDKWQRIAFQAALGSDPMRELLGALEAYAGGDQPTWFAEKP